MTVFRSLPCSARSANPVVRVFKDGADLNEFGTHQRLVKIFCCDGGFVQSALHSSSE
jgi:hypothetical protein